MMGRVFTFLTAALLVSFPVFGASLASAIALAGEAAVPQEEDLPAVELFTPSAQVEPLASTTVGMRVTLEELVIPGSDLRAVPVADPGRADVIVRVINVFNHGSDRRYNIEVMPLVEGTFDLGDHLERVDGSSMDNVPELPIAVEAITDESLTLPNDLEIPHPKRVGGYRGIMIGLGILWVLGLLCLIFLGHNKRRAAGAASEKEPVTLAERLRPLVERAGRGELSNGERAELERLVLAHWRGRRDLAGVPVADAVSSLRRDEEAGPLLVKLEEWFHSPRPAELTESDIQELLRPYGAVSSGGAYGGGAS